MKRFWKIPALPKPFVLHNGLQWTKLTPKIPSSRCPNLINQLRLRWPASFQITLRPRRASFRQGFQVPPNCPLTPVVIRQKSKNRSPANFCARLLFCFCLIITNIPAIFMREYSQIYRSWFFISSAETVSSKARILVTTSASLRRLATITP